MFDTARLKSPMVRKTFVLELQNRFQWLQVVDDGEAGDMNHDAGTDNEDLIKTVWNKLKVA